MENFELRPMIESDLRVVLAWRNHPDIRRYMFNRHEISMMEHQNWFERASGDPSRKLMLLWQGIVPLGYVGFDNIRPTYPINWGFYRAVDSPKGTGTRLGKLALNYGFQILGAHKIVGQVAEYNAPSLSFHLKFGFQQEGHLRQHFFADGKYWDQISLGLLKSEWHQTHWNEAHGIDAKY